ncbi:hypothetical protein G3N56_14045 [Desulfovibrio sulfodismutans]|uniref:Uncharacterized protein n=1 Tax=Desulfolutivibrio sulfodismutans TaxID=63561 RepID=A0A7K3NPU9_9BACT|nr:hypothetical protein [Desulfolutivibrio sulfodismutans]NDY57853.1 hypothetical protein [Desulfolutivibrio sulfodismutans]QLA11588.1 hypothetical protein GD606_04520 [Desulfolutivibrio sulfodismutans DSM 3696]
MKKLTALCLLAVLLPCLAMAQTNVPLRGDEKKKLDTFFSNFAEVNMKNFTQGPLSDEELLYFATWHCIINAADSFQTTNDGNDIIIPASAIDKATEKYLGQTIKKHLKPSYVESMASGEAYVFAQVDSLQKRDDGTYLAKGTIYATGSGAVIDPHATAADWKKAGETVNPQETFTGVIRKTDGEQGRYILLEYAVQERP